MPTTTCPICNRVLIRDHMIKYIDYSCKNNTNNHFYAKRLVEDVLTKVKLRLTDKSGEKIYVKFNYDLNNFEVWSKMPDKNFDFAPKRILINGTFIPDFSDIEKLKSKIKVYLTFS